jgi:hypothetical protein
MTRTFFTLLITLALVSPALSQDRAADPKACAPGERMQPREGTTGQAPGQPAQGDNLSDKLARTDGVICPPNVGNDMRLPTPEGGRMPVIPPPGSPGGDPSVQPK